MHVLKARWNASKVAIRLDLLSASCLDYDEWFTLMAFIYNLHINYMVESILLNFLKPQTFLQKISFLGNLQTKCRKSILSPYEQRFCTRSVWERLCVAEKRRERKKLNFKLQKRIFSAWSFLRIWRIRINLKLFDLFVSLGYVHVNKNKIRKPATVENKCKEK